MPRQWADVVFNAVDGWTDCGAYTARFPCHEPSGLAPECMLTAWLVDHGIPRSAFGAGTELRELGIVRNYWKRQPSLVYCNLHRLSECAGLAKSASRDASRGGGAIRTPFGKQEGLRLRHARNEGVARWSVGRAFGRTGDRCKRSQAAPGVACLSREWPTPGPQH